jgi:uncharacterized membrane protein YphA (DoxX/SURF4 family)
MNRKIAVEIIAFLFIFLFVYAAASKLLDIEKFRVQLGQSPLLTVFAGWVAWVIPTLEILIAVLLLLPTYRFIAFFAALTLMVMFTSYIVVILNFGSYIPCSCGGILEKLGWTQHLIFNCVFILLALAGILILAWDRYIIAEKS